jgi:putative aldouronate transport system permease protein
VFGAVNTFALLLLSSAMLYPFIYTLSISISDPIAVTKGQVKLLPVGFSLGSYQVILASKRFFLAYWNTFVYSMVAAAISIILLMLSSYPLSVKSLKGRKWITLYLTITMFFGGGMIPSYLLIRNLHLLNTIWAIVLPGALSTWYIILCRTFIQGIPESLRESAMIDGASEWRILIQIIIPLTKALIAVMALYSVVGQWNNYFGPMLYLTSDNKYPLQLVLRRLLVDDTMKTFYGNEGIRRTANAIQPVSQAISSASMMLTIAPIVCIYPFLQKYFAKGVMIGSIQG